MYIHVCMYTRICGKCFCRANSKMFSHFSCCAIGSDPLLLPHWPITSSDCACRVTTNHIHTYVCMCIKKKMKNHIKIVHLLFHCIPIFFFFFTSVYTPSYCLHSRHIYACMFAAIDQLPRHLLPRIACECVFLFMSIVRFSRRSAHVLATLPTTVTSIAEYQ